MRNPGYPGGRDDAGSLDVTRRGTVSAGIWDRIRLLTPYCMSVCAYPSIESGVCRGLEVGRSIGGRIVSCRCLCVVAIFEGKVMSVFFVL
jgi:hypothetical protein